jgi:hypothetical protein
MKIRRFWTIGGPRTCTYVPAASCLRMLHSNSVQSIQKRLAMINQEPRASPKLSSPAAMSVSMSPTTRSPAQPPREYKVLRAARVPTPASTPGLTPSAAAPIRAPVPIPVPGQPLSATGVAETDTEGPSPAALVLYEAVPAGTTKAERVEEPTPEMEEFQDLLTEYLRGESILSMVKGANSVYLRSQ